MILVITKDNNKINQLYFKLRGRGDQKCKKKINTILKILGVCRIKKILVNTVITEYRSVVFIVLIISSWATNSVMNSRYPNYCRFRSFFVRLLNI